MLVTGEAMAVEIQRRRFSVDDYYRMAEVGILQPDERVELIDGEVRLMPPIGPGHASIVDRLTELLVAQTSGKAIVRVQNPVRLNDYTEPEPDLALLRRRDDFYVSAHPQPADVLVVVEVAATTLAYDRREKLPRYAATGIPEVWIVDVVGGTVEQYTRPEEGSYAVARVLRRGEVLACEALPELGLSVQQIVGQAG